MEEKEEVVVDELEVEEKVDEEVVVEEVMEEAEEGRGSGTSREGPRQESHDETRLADSLITNHHNLHWFHSSKTHRNCSLTPSPIKVKRLLHKKALVGIRGWSPRKGGRRLLPPFERVKGGGKRKRKGKKNGKRG